jgi:hypothetical protein
MKTNRIILVIAVLVMLTDLALIGLYSTNESFAFENTRLGTLDMVIRTGGRLQDPFQEEYSFPLSHNLTSPGNTSFSGLDGMKDFSVFSQIAFGRNVLDGPVQVYEPHFDILGAMYSYSLNLSSSIHITTSDSVYICPYDRFENLRLNETTIQVLTLPKDIILIPDSQGEWLEVTFFESTGSGFYFPDTNTINYTSKKLYFPINNSITLSLQSEWSLVFLTRNLPPIEYSGNETLGTFQIFKEGEISNVSMSGSFKCYYVNREVFVLGQRIPYLEISLFIGGILLLFVYQWTKRKEM